MSVEFRRAAARLGFERRRQTGAQERCARIEMCGKYAVVIHEDPDGGFWGEVPALPGCYSPGETLDELEDNIREAIAGVFEVLKVQGQAPDTNIRILDVAV